MDTLTIFAIVFAVLMFALFSGSLISLAMGVVSIVMVLFLADHPMVELVSRTLWTSSFQFLLVCIPMFMLMGNLMSESGLSEYLFDFCTVWLGRLPGGLTHSILAGAGLFGAATGSAVADAAAISAIAYPEMQKRGYDRTVTTGALAAGGTIGILMPPSITMVFFAFLTGTDLGRLFMAGILPAILMVLLFMLATAVVAKLNPKLSRRERTYSGKERATVTLRFIPIFLGIASVLAMIYMGVTTPTEAAAAGAFVFLLLSIIYRKFSFKMLARSLRGAVVVTSATLFIMVCAMVPVFFVGYYGVGKLMVDFIKGLAVHPLLVIGVIYIIMILLGAIVDAVALQLMAIPLLTPVVVALGFSPVWFGIMFVVLIQLALVTPPVGLVVFTVAAACPGARPAEVFKGNFPYFIAMVFCLALFTLVPQIVLWLPSTMR